MGRGSTEEQNGEQNEGIVKRNKVCGVRANRYE